MLARRTHKDADLDRLRVRYHFRVNSDKEWTLATPLSRTRLTAAAKIVNEQKWGKEEINELIGKLPAVSKLRGDTKA